jgi:hypothetical protein
VAPVVMDVSKDLHGAHMKMEFFVGSTLMLKGTRAMGEVSRENKGLI